MNLAEFTIKNKLLSIIVILVTIAAGWNAYRHMPRFEDPEFIIREAVIVANYPGASPREVAEELTEPLERVIQQLQEVKTIKSVSTAGRAELKVEAKYEFSKTPADLQLVWTRLRNKLSDAEASLPKGTSRPILNDDFGDVFGLYYLITGNGYTPAELRFYAKELQSELLQVAGVGKVGIGGERREVIYVEITRENAAALGVSVRQVYEILSQQNAVVSAGDAVVGDQRIVIDPSGGIDTVEAVRNLLVSASSEGRMIYLKDLAEVRRDYETPPNLIFRYNGEPAAALAVSAVLNSNIVKIGEAIDRKLAESMSRRPLGIEVHEFYHQGKIVDGSVKNFVDNVIAALLIVIVTLLLFMGLRSAVVIGAVLLLTIFATLAVMDSAGIPMHRISLGALIIALGMMVDNAIVVTEGILVGVQSGMKKLEIAKRIVERTKWPLLGGTLVGIIAFAPIGFAPGSTAEYTGHLFWVIMISLLFSWLFAVTLTPLFCTWLFQEKASSVSTAQLGENAFFRKYKNGLRFALRRRLLVVAATCGLFALSLWGFKFVKQGFFPVSTTPQIVVDYWLPQGMDIERTERDMHDIEKFVKGIEGVDAVLTSVGGGGFRYMLVYGPESPNASYGQIIARVDDYRRIDAMMPRIQGFIDTRFPEAQAKVWRFVLGPGGGSKIEAAFTGPDPVVLRRLADKAKAIMIADGEALSIKDDWRQAVPVIEPIYSEQKGRRAGISREDMASSLRTTFSGERVGVFREGNDLLPIVARAPEAERTSIQDIYNIQVLSSVTGKVVPITQITDGFRTVWRDSLMRRDNRLWTIKAQSDPLPGNLASELFARLRPKIEAIELPDGYSLRWDGEHGDSQESNEALGSTLPLGFLAMVLTVFILFGTIRQPVIIWLVVPLAVVGVVIGLAVTGIPLEFMGILGVLSLSGLLIKNAIVLVDQIDAEIEEGKPRYVAVIEASASRVRPVMMGSLTTALGVIPLFFDAFFQSMAVVLVAGLLFATLLTLVIVPVLYTIFFRIKSGETAHVS